MLQVTKSKSARTGNEQMVSLTVSPDWLKVHVPVEVGVANNRC